LKRGEAMDKIVKETVRTVLYELCKENKNACPLIYDIDNMEEDEIWNKLKEILSCKNNKECDVKFKKVKERFEKTMKELGFNLT